MNYPLKQELNDNNTSLRRVLFLGLTPLIIAVFFYVCLSLSIQLSRYYSNWRLRKQFAIMQCSEHCLIVSNLSVDDIDQQFNQQVV